MASFEIGETVICYATIRDANGVLVDPTTSVKITIKNPAGTVLTNDVAMTKDSQGLYHYDFQVTTGYANGWYTTRVTAVDGTRITKQDDGFEVVP